VWDWGIFWQQVWHRDVLDAALATVSAAVAAQAIGVVLGVALGAGSTARSVAVRTVVDLYVRLFRGTPLLLQILAFYIVPSVYGIQVPVFVAGVLALGMNEAAYLSEVVRSGLLSVDRGQHEAGQTLGMSSVQILLLITLPQAARVMLPPFGSAFNSMLKTTSLLAFISYHELLRQANLTMDTMYRPFEIFAVITLYYLGMTTVCSVIQWLLERRFSLERGPSRAPTARLRPVAEI
jgi:polar amino acid transport system permease protein